MSKLLSIQNIKSLESVEPGIKFLTLK